MDKNEVIKELEELRDIKKYSQSELLNTGYRTAILDAIDLVKKMNYMQSCETSPVLNRCDCSDPEVDSILVCRVCEGYIE